MSGKLNNELMKRTSDEPYARLLGMEVIEIGSGSSLVRMRVRPDLENIFGVTHGGALFSLIDEAFQIASNARGVLAVALNVSITYAASPKPSSVLEARATEIHKTKRTATYFCEVREKEEGNLIASAHALAYRTGKQIDFS
ncbi:MAG: PaaI family thioesterase [Desulfomonilaceae bacterium]